MARASPCAAPRDGEAEAGEAAEAQPLPLQDVASPAHVPALSQPLVLLATSLQAETALPSP